MTVQARSDLDAAAVLLDDDVVVIDRPANPLAGLVVKNRLNTFPSSGGMPSVVAVRISSSCRDLRAASSVGSIQLAFSVLRVAA